MPTPTVSFACPSTTTSRNSREQVRFPGTKELAPFWKEQENETIIVGVFQRLLRTIRWSERKDATRGGRH